MSNDICAEMSTCVTGQNVRNVANRNIKRNKYNACAAINVARITAYACAHQNRHHRNQKYAMLKWADETDSIRGI
jgi:hypothetical protein